MEYHSSATDCVLKWELSQWGGGGARSGRSEGIEDSLEVRISYNHFNEAEEDYRLSIGN